MILRIIPYLLIIIPIISFFYTPEAPSSMKSGGRHVIGDLVYLLFTIPWWGKLLSILIGFVWISSDHEKKENAE